MKKITFIIADDYSDNRILLKQMCSILGINTYEATNGEEAVELFKIHTDVDMVLLDIEMPVMNGLEAAEEIKKIMPVIPVVAITAHNPAHFAERMRQAGFDDYLSKPYTLDKIKTMINKYLK